MELLSGAGGLVIIPLGICSVAAWAIILERWLRFRGLSRMSHQFLLEAKNAILLKDPKALSELCAARRAKVPLAEVLSAALDESGRPRPKALQVLERRRLWVAYDLKGSLWMLGTLGAAAPFIGLFGTVVGILGSFKDLAASPTGGGGFSVVAAGISEALIATAVGIGVAVVAVMAYNALQVQLSRHLFELKMGIEDLGGELGEDVESDARPRGRV